MVAVAANRRQRQSGRGKQTKSIIPLKKMFERKIVMLAPVCPSESARRLGAWRAGLFPFGWENALLTDGTPTDCKNITGAERPCAHGGPIAQLCAISNGSVQIMQQNPMQQICSRCIKGESKRTMEAQWASVIYMDSGTYRFHAFPSEVPFPPVRHLILSAPCTPAAAQQLLHLFQQPNSEKLWTLVLRGDPRWIGKLIPLPKGLKNIHRLIFEEMPSRKEVLVGATRLAAAVPNLQGVGFRRCGLRIEGLKFLLSSASKLPALLASLNELDLTENDLDDSCAGLLAAELKRHQNLKLHSLWLGGNSWKASEILYVLQQKNILSHFHHLALDNGHDVLGSSGSLAANTNLSSLSLSEAEVSPRLLRRFLTDHRTTLRYLDLSCNSEGLKEEDVLSLLQALFCTSSTESCYRRTLSRQGSMGINGLHSSQVCALQHLNLAKTGLSGAIAAPLAAALRHPSCCLVSLDLSENKLCGRFSEPPSGKFSYLAASIGKNDYPMQPLVEALQASDDHPPVKLESLYMRNCCLPPDTITELAGAMLLNQKQLRLLDVVGSPYVGSDELGGRNVGAHTSSSVEAAEIALRLAAEESGLEVLLVGYDDSVEGSRSNTGGRESKSARSAVVSRGNRSFAKTKHHSGEYIHTDGEEDGRMTVPRRGRGRGVENVKKKGSGKVEHRESFTNVHTPRKGSFAVKGDIGKGATIARRQKCNDGAETLTTLRAEDNDDEESFSDGTEEETCSEESEYSESEERSFTEDEYDDSNSSTMDKGTSSSSRSDFLENDCRGCHDLCSLKPGRQGYKGYAKKETSGKVVKNTLKELDVKSISSPASRRKRRTSVGREIAVKGTRCRRRQAQEMDRLDLSSTKDQTEDMHSEMDKCKKKLKVAKTPLQRSDVEEEDPSSSLPRRGSHAASLGSAVPSALVVESGRIGGRDGSREVDPGKRHDAEDLENETHSDQANIRSQNRVSHRAEQGVVTNDVADNSAMKEAYTYTCAAPFLLCFSVRPEIGMLPMGIPLPSDPVEREAIRQSLNDLSNCALRLLLPRSSLRYVCNSSLQELLRRQPQHILLAFKRILSGGLPLLGFPDVRTLEQLQKCNSLSPVLQLLLSTILEDLPRYNLNHKYSKFGSLDFADCICTLGLVLYDGGPGCQATTAAEFRVLWVRKHTRHHLRGGGNKGLVSAGSQHQTRLGAPTESRRGFDMPTTSVLDLVQQSNAQSAIDTAQQLPIVHRRSAADGVPDASATVLFATPAPLHRLKKPMNQLNGAAPASPGGCEFKLEDGDAVCNRLAPSVAKQRGGRFWEQTPVRSQNEGGEGIGGEPSGTCSLSPEKPCLVPSVVSSAVSSPSVASVSSANFLQQHQQHMVYAWEDDVWLRTIEESLECPDLCPSVNPPSGANFPGICTCREVIVVDVQTDEILRRRIWEVQKTHSSFSRRSGASTNAAAQRRRVEYIRRVVQRSIRPATNWEQQQELRKIAASKQGFVPIGMLKYGVSRHMAILFKVLCDSVHIPCRLMRAADSDGEEWVYNVVLIGTADGELEQLVPVFWTLTKTASAYQAQLRKQTPGNHMNAHGLPLNAFRDVMRLNPPTVQMPFYRGPLCCTFCTVNMACGASKCCMESLNNMVNPNPSSQRRHTEGAAERRLMGRGGFVATPDETALDRFLLKASGSKIYGAGILGHLAMSQTSVDAEVNLDFYFTFVERMGKGNFGEVWRVRLKPEGLDESTRNDATDALATSKKEDAESAFADIDISASITQTPSVDYALKLVPCRDENVPEAEMMRRYSHPRVVPFLGVFKGFQMLEDRTKKKVRQRSFCFLMDVADTSLEALLEKHEKAETLMSPAFILGVLLDTARGMQYLHGPSHSTPHLLHRDLKPANILMKGGRALVADFGVSRVAESFFEYEMTLGAGSEGYMAPEQRTAAYDRPADVWAFGVVCARLAGLKEWKSLATCRPQSILQQMGIHNTFLGSLTLACLDLDPLIRPSFKQIVNVLVDELLRIEFEMILRSPYRNKYPLMEPKSCCCALFPSNGQLNGVYGEETSAALTLPPSCWTTGDGPHGLVNENVIGGRDSNTLRAAYNSQSVSPSQSHRRAALLECTVTGVSRVLTSNGKNQKDAKTQMPSGRRLSPRLSLQMSERKFSNADRISDSESEELDRAQLAFRQHLKSDADGIILPSSRGTSGSLWSESSSAYENSSNHHHRNGLSSLVSDHRRSLKNNFDEALCDHVKNRQFNASLVRQVPTLECTRMKSTRVYSPCIGAAGRARTPRSTSRRRSLPLVNRSNDVLRYPCALNQCGNAVSESIVEGRRTVREDRRGVLRRQLDVNMLPISPPAVPASIFGRRVSSRDISISHPWRTNRSPVCSRTVVMNRL